MIKYGKVNFWVRACIVVVALALTQGFRPRDSVSAERIICILGGTGTRHAIPVLAETFGLYPKYGLDATIVRIGSGTIATAALLGGEADVINTSGPALINARLAGTPVLYIANFNNWSDAHVSGSTRSDEHGTAPYRQVCRAGPRRRICAHAARVHFSQIRA